MQTTRYYNICILYGVADGVFKTKSDDTKQPTITVEVVKLNSKLIYSCNVISTHVFIPCTATKSVSYYSRSIQSPYQLDNTCVRSYDTYYSVHIFIVIGRERALGSGSKSARASVTRFERVVCVCVGWCTLRRKNENEFMTKKKKKKAADLCGVNCKRRP